jgi:hypothetical protein
MSKSLKLTITEVNAITFSLDQILQCSSFKTAPEMLAKSTLANLVQRLLTRSNKMHFEGRNSCTFLVNPIDQLTLQCLDSFGFLSSFEGLEKNIIFKFLNPHFYEKKKHKTKTPKRIR